MGSTYARTKPMTTFNIFSLKRRHMGSIVTIVEMPILMHRQWLEKRARDSGSPLKLHKPFNRAHEEGEKVGLL